MHVRVGDDGGGRQPAVAAMLRVRQAGRIQRPLGLVGQHDVMGGAVDFAGEVGGVEMLVDAARRPGGGHCVQAQFLAGDAVQRQRQRLVLADAPAGHEPGALGRRIAAQPRQVAPLAVVQQQIDGHQRQHLHRPPEIRRRQQAAGRFRRARSRRSVHTRLTACSRRPQPGSATTSGGGLQPGAPPPPAASSTAPRTPPLPRHRDAADPAPPVRRHAPGEARSASGAHP